MVMSSTVEDSKQLAVAGSVFAGRINIVVPRPSRMYAGDAIKMQLGSGMDPDNVDVN